ncbi:FAD/NAD(P)-binding protein [Roseiconus lacunae]|uniref:FAD/NAD(P)-binding protein n=1 Tax=Roseiconus lacunae TaxID=2605694 RepID=UPI001E55D77A|nr:FAD/NAD(P)-binding domain-containing protein [Roseiconus lacunae]MCD0460174.1 FAD/NAD(P)-binding protein [Roseiconus lacunae]
MSTVTYSTDQIIDTRAFGPSVRVAVIGCGPRGSYCLESLLRQIKANGGSGDIEITIFEPSKFPGAGIVYDPRQPHYLRMNLAAGQIDFWSLDNDKHAKNRRHLSLLRWLDKHHPQHAYADAYVPRAVVGEYLHECYQATIEELSKYCHVERVTQKVNDLRRERATWVVTTEEQRQVFDEVVITVGHEGLRCSGRVGVTGSAPCDTPVSSFPFSSLSGDRAKLSGDVFVTGFGLTAIDSVLSLTEGRGGKFLRNGNRLCYVPQGNEPNRIHLVSRSGRPMLAKPTEKVEPIDDSFWDPYREQLGELRQQVGQIDFRRQLWPIVCQSAAALLNRNGIDESGASVGDWFRRWGRYSMNHSLAVRAMITSWLVATAQRPYDAPAALGTAWRTLYPQMVTLISHGGLIPKSWPAYSRTAAEMERIAFGPPAESIEKVVTLARQGILRCSCQRDEPTPSSENVIAVLAKPNEPEENGLIDKLVQQGYLQHDPMTGAIAVDEEGRADAPRGTKNLAVFGRCTEGIIIGNDTLSRSLHPHLERWAATMITRRSRPVTF